MLDEKDWITATTLIHPKGVLLGRYQSLIQVIQISPYQTRTSTGHGL